MERRSEIVEGLENLRDAILGYDARTDRSGVAWDELRVELDRAVLKLSTQVMGCELMVAGDRVSREVIALIEKEFERYTSPDIRG